ncbi:MAG TPA: sulfotransferase, partial [Acidimicrobiia bacterium]|nr:sulfotransferase [Acidimicrobiia bacterium]
GWPCGCGEPVAECPFWTEVLGAAFAGAAVPTVAEMRRLEDGVARTRHVAKIRRRPADPAVARYRDVRRRLYRAIEQLTGARLLVDSSKDPADALVAAQIDEVPLSVVHVIRDPRAVAFSWARPTRYPGRPGGELMRQRHPFDSSLRWLVWNGVIEAMLPRAVGGRYLRVRYEDVVASPRESLRRMLEVADHGGEPPVGDDRVVVLSRPHCLASNPGRSTTGPVALVADEAWEHEMTASARRAAVAPALPLMAHYGYGWRRPRQAARGA